MAQSTDKLRELRIRTGVLKRAVQEKIFCEKQLVKDKERLTKMMTENADDQNIKVQEQVIQETSSMIPGCQQRLVDAYHDLKQVIDETDSTLSEDKIFIAANELLDATFI